MSKQRNLTEENFESLLKWLAPDREQAGRRYEEIRQSLIKIFVWRGISEAEDLADETITRVAQKVPEIAADYVGNPALFFYGVAKKLLKEYLRKQKLQVSLDSQQLATSPPTGDPETFEKVDECLKKCVEKLSPENHSLILNYYLKEKQAKIDHRKELARRLKVDANALRVRAHRIRASLEKCIKDCLETTEELDSSPPL
jgi:RNA polymerase sigma factor (sigma-70 family)